MCIKVVVIKFFQLVHQVPLGARYNEVISEDRRFTPQLLVTKLRSEGKEVGLVT
jgi:hypothetical protein